MNITKATNEAEALGTLLRLKPYVCGRREWERMQCLRTFILQYKLK